MAFNNINFSKTFKEMLLFKFFKVTDLRLGQETNYSQKLAISNCPTLAQLILTVSKLFKLSNLTSCNPSLSVITKLVKDAG
nr:MAG TPA: hypothetical protein [Bacteriophage sp.]